MKIVFISNYLSAHQAPICNVLYKLLGSDFSFISLKKISKERLILGMPTYNYLYNIEFDSSKSSRQKIFDLINNADAVICGNCPDYYITHRLKNNKLTFKYVERLYKTKPDIKKSIHSFIGTYLHYIRFLKYPFYVLCASAYTAGDLNRFFKFINRTFVWGYFPKYIKCTDIDSLIESKEKHSILWVGRFLDWKHPEIPVLLAELLKKNKYEFDLTIAGTGNMQEYIEKLVYEKKLDDCVHLIGSVKNDEVRRLMDKSEFFLFTSNYQEGWGAVLNEAMNSACVCLASHAIGSSPFLVRDNQNGILFNNEDLNDLYSKLTNVFDDDSTKKTIAKNAYKTIADEWNEEIAAHRLIQLCTALINSGETPFDSGICSDSPIINNDWYII